MELEVVMMMMRRKAVRADTKATEQAKDVLLILSATLVDPTTSEECLCHQSF
jgi:hypothetical protein